MRKLRMHIIVLSFVILPYSWWHCRFRHHCRFARTVILRLYLLLLFAWTILYFDDIVRSIVRLSSGLFLGLFLRIRISAFISIRWIFFTIRYFSLHFRWWWWGWWCHIWGRILKMLFWLILRLLKYYKYCCVILQPTEKCINHIVMIYHSFVNITCYLLLTTTRQ